MSDYRREPVEGAAPLNHTDAETLISARLDGPLDPVMNRALLAHLAICAPCRAFATQMESMATAFRDLPVLPPSPAVARKVRAEIRSGGSPIRRFGNWMANSKTAPATALAGAAVALALVTASVFGTFDDDNGNQPTVNAPNFAAQSGGTDSAAKALTETPPGELGAIGAPTQQANVQVAPTQEPTSNTTAGGADVAMRTTEPASGEQGSGNAGAKNNTAPASQSSGSAGNDVQSTAPPEQGSGAPPSDTSNAARNSAPTPTAPSQAAMVAASEQSPEVTATQEPAPTETMTPEPPATETATPEPEPTETAILEPTATEEPAPTETATSTPEPAPTETSTPEPEPTEPATSTPEPSATGTPTLEPTAIIGLAGESTPAQRPAAPTATTASKQSAPTPTETPGIVPRDGETVQEAPQDTVDQTGDETGEASTVSPSNAGSDETPASQNGGQIEQRGGNAASDQSEAINEESPTPEDGQGGETEHAAAPAGPLAFSDLPDGAPVIGTSGSFIPSGTGLFAVEHPGGGMEIYDGNGNVVVSGYGYNPVWGNGGQTLFTAGGAISEGSSAINGWSAGGGPEFLTDGSAIDTPAGDIGGLAYVRFQPGGDPVMSLWLVGSDAPIWQSNDYQLVSQTVYLSGGMVFAPTDQGWLAIPAGGGDAAIVGGLGFDGVDEVILSPDQSQVAFVSGGTIYVAPAGNPAAATHVADAGNGGVAWTSMGLAIASGGQVSLWTGGGAVVIVDGGGDLTAPIWTGNALIVADAAQGGATKAISAEQINAVLAG